MSDTSIVLNANCPLPTRSRKGPSWIYTWEVWLSGALAAGISGGANGVITGFAAVGIDPEHFNFDMQGGLHRTLFIAGVSALMSGIMGVAAYLKQSPLPKTP